MRINITLFFISAAKVRNILHISEKLFVYSNKNMYFCNVFQTKYRNMLRIAVQSKGRLFDDTMNLLAEADIKVSASKRTLLVQSSNFPLEVLYLRDDDIPQSVASGVADIGIVGENEFVERGEECTDYRPSGFQQVPPEPRHS